MAGGLFVLGPAFSTGLPAITLGAFPAINLLFFIGNVAPIPAKPPRRLATHWWAIGHQIWNARRHRCG